MRCLGVANDKKTGLQTSLCVINQQYSGNVRTYHDTNQLKLQIKTRDRAQLG